MTGYSKQIASAAVPPRPHLRLCTYALFHGTLNADNVYLSALRSVKREILRYADRYTVHATMQHGDKTYDVLANVRHIFDRRDGRGMLEGRLWSATIPMRAMFDLQQGSRRATLVLPGDRVEAIHILSAMRGYADDEPFFDARFLSERSLRDV